ncbi:MAG TPA: zinc ribbon domain-containing protein [Candidatus Limnocylindria bacterium]|nr:zinc ribbon domain-containing protein [Candidatus Limnocylindria bacterium]
MPTYDYRCRKCKHKFELFHSIKDDTPKRCPKCRARADRVPSGGAGILFKGSGFYITDYRSKSYQEGAKQERSGASDSGETGSSPGKAASSDSSSGGGASTGSGGDAGSGSRGDATSGSRGDASSGSRSAPSPESKSRPKSRRSGGGDSSRSKRSRTRDAAPRGG